MPLVVYTLCGIILKKIKFSFHMFESGCYEIESSGIPEVHLNHDMHDSWGSQRSNYFGFFLLVACTLTGVFLKTIKLMFDVV